jgi:hypothetical protein
MESTTLGNNGNGAADREKAMETILKCMRLAADPGATEGERDVAQRKAEQVMAKWQIGSLEMRLKAESKTDKPKSTESVKQTYEGIFDPQADWEMMLADSIAKTFNSRVIVIDGRSRLHFFGSVSDLEIIDYFFSKLRLEIDSWAEDAYPRGVRDRRSYAYGMTSRVSQRMDELYKAVEQMMPNDCKALVLVDKALVKQAVNEVYASLGKLKHRTVRNDAYSRGYMDGNNLNLESNRSRLQ